jgi:hypothetical protein
MRTFQCVVMVAFITRQTVIMEATFEALPNFVEVRHAN